ncbi:peroxisomal dehydratase [Cristinia sonorae]|uniref:Peroxisomal dehydratase n=1 Tax=Cristinia sonorae TaxID=1940300 RepID=A0A8K0UE53_9AGAR|nr:peroxisomal dehydratase [Cristinia sonorae]
MSSVDLGRAVGHVDADVPVGWNQRDLLLYAVGIGAKADEHALVNELDKSWTPFPTYPVVLMLKHDGQDVNVFTERIGGSTPTPGLPKLDPNRTVHATQSIQVLKPLPAVSGAGWKLQRRVVAVSENKSGIVLESEYKLVDPQGTPYAILYSASFNLGAKATGKPFSKRIAGAPPAKPIPKDRNPDWVVSDQTTPEQAAIYRLSGDYNGLHIDPSIGKAAGFGGVILHGLSSYGFAARAVVKAVGGGDPSSLKYFGVRFSSPVKPGDALETRMWAVGTTTQGLTEVAFEVKNVTTGKVSLSNGVAWVKKSEKGKL